MAKKNITKAKPEKKAGRGRPSKYSEELAHYICEQLMAGRSLRSVCKEEDMPNFVTVFRWLDSNMDFRNQYARAREVQAEILADEIIDIADDGTNDWMEIQKQNGAVVVCDHENINRSRLRVDSRKWAASKLLPKKYGEKISQELTGKDGAPLMFGRCSDDELKFFLQHGYFPSDVSGTGNA